MKKILMLIIVSVLSLSLFAAEYLRISPYGGYANINMAATDYRDYKGDNQTDAPVWGQDYQVKQMIAIGSVEHMSKENGDIERGYHSNRERTEILNPLNITITAPYGYNFISQSNPEYKRPFKLILVGSVTKESTPGYADFKFYHVFDQNTQSFKLDNELFQRLIDKLDNTNAFYYMYHHDITIWFDLILVLPGTVTNTGNLELDNGEIYPLKQTDDYVAVVSISMEQGNKKNDISIPISGYYSSSSTPAENFVSLSVSTTSNASNLNMNRDAGKEVKVATIDFIMDSTITDVGGNATPDNEKQSIGELEAALKSAGKPTNIKIFFSASNAPLGSVEDGFNLVHTSVIPGSVLTNYNSASFEVITYAKEGRNLYNRETVDTVVGTDSNPVQQIFSGDEYVSDPNSSKITHHDGTDADQVQPDIYKAYGTINDITGAKPRVYYAWSGEVYVKIDQNIETRMMMDGRYTGRIYVHVVGDF